MAKKNDFILVGVALCCVIYQSLCQPVGTNHGDTLGTVVDASGPYAGSAAKVNLDLLEPSIWSTQNEEEKNTESLEQSKLRDEDDCASIGTCIF